MDKTDDYKIPEDLRRMAEGNVDQARQAYEQLSSLAHQAGEWAARANGELAASTVEIQAAGWAFAEHNLSAGFDFAARMARASNLGEIFQVQAEFAQAQLKAVDQQAQELRQMAAQAAERTAKASDQKV